MRQIRSTLVPLLLLTFSGACTDAESNPDTDTDIEDTDTDVEDTDTYQADPDVDTYVPEDYRPVDPKTVVFLGDSITAGSGASSAELRYKSLLVEDQSTMWQTWAEQDLESLYGPLEVIDVSVAGAQTGSLIERQLPALDEAIGGSLSGETIIVMTIGGNDMQGALPAMLLNEDKEAAYEERIRPALDNFATILDYFEDPARFPDGAKVFLTNVYEPTDNGGRAAGCFFGVDIGPALPYLDRANDEIRALAVERGVAAIDLRGHFLGHGHNHEDATLEAHDAADPTLWMANDCIHPNDRGHHEVRRLFLTAIDGRPLEAPGE